MTTIREMQRKIHTLACAKGWYDGVDASNPYVRGAFIANIHGEASEALECIRDGDLELRFEPKYGGQKPCGLPSELADVVIRALDTAEALGIDLMSVIELKHEFNKLRPHRHGNKAL